MGRRNRSTAAETVDKAVGRTRERGYLEGGEKVVAGVLIFVGLVAIGIEGGSVLPRTVGRSARTRPARSTGAQQ